MVDTLERCMNVMEEINRKYQLWQGKAITRETTVAKLAGRENLSAALQKMADVIDTLKALDDIQNNDVCEVLKKATALHGIISEHLFQCVRVP